MAGIETSDGRQIEDFGFVFADMQRVRLGDLPAMPTEQFAEYAIDTIIQIFQSEKTSLWLKQQILCDAHYMLGKVVQAKYSSGGLGNFPIEDDNLKDILGEIASIEGNPSRSYKENPFVLEDNNINISNMYQVSPARFTAFAIQTLQGGLFGWNKPFVVPESVTNNAFRLIKVVRSTMEKPEESHI